MADLMDVDTVGCFEHLESTMGPSENLFNDCWQMPELMRPFADSINSMTDAQRIEYLTYVVYTFVPLHEFATYISCNDPVVSQCFVDLFRLLVTRRSTFHVPKWVLIVYEHPSWEQVVHTAIKMFVELPADIGIEIWDDCDARDVDMCTIMRDINAAASRRASNPASGVLTGKRTRTDDVVVQGHPSKWCKA